MYQIFIEHLLCVCHLETGKIIVLKKSLDVTQTVSNRYYESLVHGVPSTKLALDFEAF